MTKCKIKKCLDREWKIQTGKCRECSHYVGTEETKKEGNPNWNPLKCDHLLDKNHKYCIKCGMKVVKSEFKKEEPFFCTFCDKQVPCNCDKKLHQKQSENWEEKYRKKFGLCSKGEKCQCKSEINFIRTEKSLSYQEGKRDGRSVASFNTEIERIKKSKTT